MEAGVEQAGGLKAVPGPVVQIDEGRIQAHLDEVVRATVADLHSRHRSCGANIVPAALFALPTKVQGQIRSSRGDFSLRFGNTFGEMILFQIEPAP